MTSLGIQAWVQLLNGVRMMIAHTCFAEPFNVLQVLGNSYRWPPRREPAPALSMVDSQLASVERLLRECWMRSPPRACRR